MDFNRLDELFSDSEQQQLLEAVQGLLERKQAALQEAAQMPATKDFTAHDFGIPQLEALLQKIGGDDSEDVPSPPGPQR